MRKVIFILLICSYYLSNAQQLPHYSLYMFNNAIINPAAISAKNKNQITLMIRNQWSGFSGAPKTQSISYYNINQFKYGAGANILYDQTGPISILRGSIDGSYIIPLEHKNKLSVGLSANLLQYKIDNSLITLENDGLFDPVMQDQIEKVLGHSIGAGVYYYNDDFYLGLSTNNIIRNKLDVKLNNELISHYYLQGGYTFNINNLYKISPSLLVTTIGSMSPQLDAGTRFTYNNLLSFGVTYRSNDAIVGICGLDYQSYSFGYSYDITTSLMNIPSTGSHELILTYRFETIEKDTDKDGVIDKIDECPDIPGLIENNGCPDTDKDGIIDKNDKCPDFPGLRINDGCPDGDKDGIIDKHDRCPDIPGLKEHDGCPDTDRDGIRDDMDRCPLIPGILKHLGCPDTLVSFDTIYKPVKIKRIISITTPDTVDILEVGDIYFDIDKSDLKERSKLILDNLAKHLIKEPVIRLRIEAHTDETATSKYNINLSNRRAKAVKSYLVQKGVNHTRLITKGFGETNPIADNKTEEGRSKNRRVVFIILK